jgi:Cu+-exporting ATPase
MQDFEEIEVEGMTCANCAMGVRKGLEKIGLNEVDVNFSTGEVRYKNDQKLSSEKISQTVEDSGYHVKSADSDEKNSTLSKIEKKFYFSLIFTIPLFAHMFLPFAWLHNAWVQLGLALPVVGVGFWHFGKSAYHSLKNGMPNMDVLIFIGSMSAFAYSLVGTLQYIGTPEVANYLFYETAATIITLVLLGNVLEHRSVKQTTTAISELSELQKNTAKRIVLVNGEEQIEEVDASELSISDQLQVNEGDRIPVDGRIQKGNAKVDESMISGESDALKKESGDKVVGGTIVQSGNFQMIVTAVGKDTVLAKIIELVKKAQSDKPNIQRLGDRVSAIFVPVVVGIALLTFSIWYFALDIGLQKAMMNAVAVLVISCPCAMGLATPTAVMVGLGRAAKNGILIKGGATVERFAKIKHIVFDKTGTLTTGDFSIKKVDVLDENLSEEEVLSIIYSLEKYSTHPIAKSLVKTLQARGLKSMPLMEQEEVKGKGIQAKDLEGNFYQLGAAKWLNPEGDASLYLSKNEKLIASLMIEDEVRSDSHSMLASFNKIGIKTHLLSGDKAEKTSKLAKELGIDSFKAEQMPEEKLKEIEALQKEGYTAMVGDGINDAPALSKATVGISLSNSTQIAIQSAQVILLNAKSLKMVFESFLISKHTFLTIKQNLFWAFFYNVLAIPLAAMGYLDPMIAALSMAFSDVIVIGNSIRLKRKKID